MTRQQFNICYSETKNYTDEDAYLSDLCLSSVWNDDETTDPTIHLEDLKIIWNAAHRAAKEIVKASGATMKKISDDYGIPYRTIQDWCAKLHEPPEYVLLMLQELLGLLPEIK